MGAKKELPKLGYNIMWSLGSIAVQRDHLIRQLQAAGFKNHEPDEITHKNALRRAIAEWIKTKDSAAASTLDDLGEEEEYGPNGEKRKHKIRALVREIDSKETAFTVFTLVAEDVDFSLLGLNFSSQLRIFLQKSTKQNRIDQPEIYCTTEIIGDLLTAQDKSTQFTQELRPIWNVHQNRYKAVDLSRLFTRIVLGIPGSVPINRGVYFVPETQKQSVMALRQLLEDMPVTNAEDPAYLLALPVIDEESSRRELSNAIHRGMCARLSTMEADLSDLQAKARKKIKDATRDGRIAEYARLKQEAQMYADLLQMQHEDIQERVTNLNKRILKSLTGPTDEEEAQAIEAAGF